MRALRLEKSFCSREKVASSRISDRAQLRAVSSGCRKGFRWKLVVFVWRSALGAHTNSSGLFTAAPGYNDYDVYYANCVTDDKVTGAPDESTSDNEKTLEAESCSCSPFYGAPAA